MRVSQGRILIPLEEGMRPWGRGLAAWLLRDARGVSAELHQASGIDSGEPGEGGTGREARGVPLLFHVPGKEEGSRSCALNRTASPGRAEPGLKPCPDTRRNFGFQA